MTITHYIKADLISSIHNGLLSPEKLTLGDLSKRYEVSVTPVRIAIQELIDEGYLKRESNRRLTIAENRKSNSSESAPPRPVDWLKKIGDDLVQQSLEGTPVLLREETMAVKYGISRNSIRQIFHQLAGRGVLKHLPRRGWELRAFRQSDLDAYIEVRVSLELKALELAWHRLVDEDLQRMLDGNLIPTVPDEEPRNDNSLHAYLVEKARNPYIADFFERHGSYYRALFDWEALDREAQVQAVRHHRAIITALLARDRRAAAQSLIDHIRDNHPVLNTRGAAGKGDAAG